MRKTELYVAGSWYFSASISAVKATTRATEKAVSPKDYTLNHKNTEICFMCFQN